MSSASRPRWTAAIRGFFLFASCVGVCGCTSIPEYIHNGFKVGPNYKTPPAPVENQWIDSFDKRIRLDPDDNATWWQNFHDPVLDDLICTAYNQNLTLKEAGMRILQARAQRNIAFGGLFPQTQMAKGDFQRSVFSTVTGQGLRGTGQRYITQWDLGFNLSWELDFWGRFRRTIEAAQANLDASMYDYDAVLVTLLGDVSSTYVNIRVAEKRIEYARANIELQRKTVTVVENRFKAGVAKQVDLSQAQALLYQTEATIYDLEIGLRQNTNLLCILMGIPPEELQSKLGKARIPVPTEDVAVGLPADLLRRRPDVRRAERAAAAQCALIGVAESDFYPHIMINGQILRSAARIDLMFRPEAYNGNIFPNWQWNILNYGRILNNVRLQDAKFQELVFAYQQTVLNGQFEAENGIVTFLKGRQRFEAQGKSVAAAETAEKIVLAQFEAGTVSIPQLILFEQNLVQQQDTLALAQGEVALGLIQIYKALGGGWQIKKDGCPPPQFPMAPQEEQKFLPPTPEPVPPPIPEVKKVIMLGPPS